VIGTNDRIVCTTFDHVLWNVVIYIAAGSLFELMAAAGDSVLSIKIPNSKCGLAR
jgi:hypothetical protein